MAVECEHRFSEMTWYQDSMWHTKCNSEFIFTGWQNHHGDLARYEHKCSKCGRKYMFSNMYPRSADAFEEGTAKDYLNSKKKRSKH